MHCLPRLLIVPMLLLAAASAVRATDIPITGLKLIVVDKAALAGKAKVVFVAKDTSIAKGAGTDPEQIQSGLGVAFDSVSGAFDMWEGERWVVNSGSVAKYVNKLAPTLGAVKVSVIKPGSLVKVVGKGLGDTPLDISAAPTGAVYVADTIVNGGDTTRLCTQFAGCAHKVIAGGTGYKLICKGNSTGDPACTAAVPPPGAMFVDQGLTVIDARTGLEWEKKTEGNGADLHNVAHTYVWAGLCSGMPGKRCQQNGAAEAACKAQTPPASWGSGCEQCSGGEGTCDLLIGSITMTAWDWLSQVNAANYAGHGDWRLPSEEGRNTSPSADPRELETLLLAPYPCATHPCIAPIFLPVATGYWSSSAYVDDPTLAWFVDYNGGSVGTGNKADNGAHVRAVRGGS